MAVKLVCREQDNSLLIGVHTHAQENILLPVVMLN